MGRRRPDDQQPTTTSSAGTSEDPALGEHLETVFRTVADGLVLVDVEGRVVLANPAAQEAIRTFGHEGPLVGSHVGSLQVSLVDESGQPVLVGDLYNPRRVLDSDEELHVRVGAASTDGSTSWFDIVVRGSGTGDGRVAVISFRDVTDEARRVARAERRERLQALLADVNELVSRRLEPDAGDDALEVGEFLQEVCELAVEVGDFRSAWVGLQDADGTLRPEAGAGAAGPRPVADLLAFQASDPRRVVSVADGPLTWSLARIAGGGISGVLAVSERVDHRSEDAERSLLLELAADVSHGLGLHAQGRLRREAEQALRGSEEWFRALVQNASDSIVVLDAAGTVRYITPGGALIMGRAPEDIVGRTAEDLLEPSEVPAVRELLTDVASRVGAERSVTLRVPHEDGSPRWVRARINNQLDNPAVRGLVINAHDVTAEQESRTRLELQARLLASVSEAVIATDPEGRVVHWNDAASQLYGWSEDEALGANVAELIPPADDPALAHAIMSTVQQGRPWAGELEIRRRDGSTVPVQIFNNPVLDAEGRISGLIGTSFDISERRRAQEIAWSRARQHATVASLSQHVLRTRDFDALVRETVDAVSDALEVDVVRVLTRSPAGVTAVVRASSGSDLLAPGQQLKLVDTPLGTSALTTQQPIVAPDVTSSPLHGRTGADDEIASAVAATIERAGVLEGVLLVLSRVRRVFTPEEADFVQSVANLLSAAMEAEQSQQKLQQLALHDSLTGLPNRTLFRDRLDQAIRRHERDGGGLAVLFCDLDRFKMVNDALGHAVGDKLLQEVGERLLELVRPGDTVARLGGDEFAVLCDDVADAAVGLAVARRITSAMASQPIPVGDAEVMGNLSIGVAACTEDPCSAEELLRDADAAMYRAKDLGRGRAELFVAEDHAHVVERFEMTTELRTALDQGQFQLRYQPEIQLTGPAVWVEALLRWDHPVRGELEPSAFMAVAEETGEITGIGEWALRTALDDLAVWRRDDPERAPECLSVNLSARQLQEPRLFDVVRSALEDSGIEPSALWFEITETAVLLQPDLAVEVLTDLKGMGVGLAIDDFGTGYSSLTYAQRLPADALKIDRSFVSGVGSDLRNHSIASAVIGLAHSLDLLVIAEGVETEDQLAALREEGCDFAQGYLWARPMRADQVLGWLSEHGRPLR